MEINFSKTLRAKWAPLRILIDRVETGSTCLGFPDIFAVDTINHRSCFIETKWSAKPPLAVNYERGQSDWLTSRSRHRVCCCTLIYSESERVVYYVAGKDSNDAADCLLSTNHVRIDLSHWGAWDSLRKLAFQLI